MPGTAWIDEVVATLGHERVSTRRADLEAASHDESSLPPSFPDAVAWPLSTDEVSALVTLAVRHEVSVTARGAGTSLEGNPIPLRGGLVVDFSRMQRVLEIRAADLSVRVEPGVVYERLNQALRPHGLFFPPSPGGSSDSATIGGMVANDASGIYSVKYGGTRDSVLAATVVVGDGRVLRLGSDCRKTSSGYHLIGLIVGAEGTLGLVDRDLAEAARNPGGAPSGGALLPERATGGRRDRQDDGLRDRSGRRRVHRPADDRRHEPLPRLRARGRARRSSSKPTVPR